jgi:hypothetical protein
MDSMQPSSEAENVRREALDRDLLTFLREEAQANRNALRDDSNANRETLLGTLKIVAYPMAGLLAIAGFLSWRSFDDVKKSIQEEAKQETKAEVVRMQEEIRQKLTAQFETPRLQQMVKDAAASQTQQVLRPLIVQQVGQDVARQVKAEQHTINSTIISETQKAVAQLQPKIEGAALELVNSSVEHNLDTPLLAFHQMVTELQSNQEANQEVLDLMLRAQSDDAAAFDRLVQLSSEPNAHPGVRATSSLAVRNISRQHNQGTYQGQRFTPPKTDEEMLQLLHDRDPRTRQAVINSLSENALRTNLAAVFQMMTNDPDLNVREAGFRRFNALTGAQPENQIQNLDNHAATAYWNAHRAELVKSK